MAIIGILTVIVVRCQYTLSIEVAEIQRKQAAEPKIDFSFKPEEIAKYIILNYETTVPLFMGFNNKSHGQRTCKFVVANGPEKSASNIYVDINLLEKPDIPFQISAIAIRDTNADTWLNNARWDAKPPPRHMNYKKVSIKIDWVGPGDQLEIYCLFVYPKPKPQNKDRVEDALTIKLYSPEHELTGAIVKKFPVLY